MSWRAGWPIVLVAALPLGAHGGGVPLALAPGDLAPPLVGLTLADGHAFQADWDSGTLKLVNFWATWCEPCKEEMPILEELYRRGRERGLVVLGVFEPWELGQVAGFLAETHVSYPIVMPDEGVVSQWGAIAIKPTSFLVDGKGRILRRYVGAQPEQAAGLVADVEAALEGRPLPKQVLPTESVIPEELRERARRQGRPIEGP